MELAAHVAQFGDQRPFDVRVNVFESDGEFHLPRFDLRADLVERLDDLLGFAVVRRSDLREHPRMGLTAANILAIKPPVEADRLREGFDSRVRSALESSAPGFLAHDGTHRASTSRSGYLVCRISSRALTPGVLLAGMVRGRRIIHLLEK